MRAAVLLAGIAMAGASCVGTPSIDKVTAEVEAAGACQKLPEGVTCDCVITTAHTMIPTIKVERSSDDTGSRLGRGTAGSSVDPRIAAAVTAAKQSCSQGKAVG